MHKPRRLALFDDQRPNQPPAQLFAAADVRVVPVTTGIRHAKFVVEVLTRHDRQLRDIRHAVHFQRQTNAVPVDGGRYRQVVDEAHPQPVALAHTQFLARRRTTESPGRGHMARYQFHVQGGGNQFVVVPGGRLVAPQPVTRCTARPQANHHETAQTTEYLSTGEGHELIYLNIEIRLAPEKANTIHLQLENRKGNGTLRSLIGGIEVPFEVRNPVESHRAGPGSPVGVRRPLAWS
ncbi:hypothetical protein D9M73_172830 [compost metagenome]